VVEARENASKKGSCACYCKWCEGMVADTYRGRRVAAGWRERNIGRGLAGGEFIRTMEGKGPYRKNS